jgi:hypothetical protein
MSAYYTNRLAGFIFDYSDDGQVVFIHGTDGERFVALAPYAMGLPVGAAISFKPRPPLSGKKHRRAFWIASSSAESTATALATGVGAIAATAGSRAERIAGITEITGRADGVPIREAVAEEVGNVG